MSAIFPRRLLATVELGPSLDAHRRTHGPLTLPEGPSEVARGTLQRAMDAVGLTGRGGSHVQSSLKLAFAAQDRRPVVVVNATEGEPASGRAHALLLHAPHLVLDGAVVLASVLGARDIAIAVADDQDLQAHAVEVAIAERSERLRFSLERPPSRYVTGEESALVRFIDGGAALPTFRVERPSFGTIGRHRAIVHNLETMAQVGLLAAHGPRWFAEVGTGSERGTTLVTLSGAVRVPGVYEVPLGAPLGAALEMAGGLTAPVAAFQVGGYGGAWLGPNRVDVALDEPSLRSVGATLGAGSIVAVPATTCVLAEASLVVRWMAGESAGQCGPCVFGLPAVASDLELLAAGRARRTDVDRLKSRLEFIEGRGACRHPDGVVRFVRSLLSVVTAHVDAHLKGGRCAAGANAGCFPLPERVEVR